MCVCVHVMVVVVEEEAGRHVTLSHEPQRRSTEVV